MSTVLRYQPHYTVSDYRQWEGRWELWSGVAVAMSPSPLGPHAKLLARLVMALGNAIDAAGCRATVLVEIDWIVASDTVVRPDVTVVCGHEPSGHVERPPALVVEVLSDSTRERDTLFKRQLYRSQGVRTYVLADPDRRSASVLWLGPDGDYTESVLTEADAPAAVELCEDCRILVDPVSLFR
ncbi:MAG: Uma2 family endonuclease [Planctomycetia bacterium]|nr:Uma2 family endonuclease [Planctomycetia bacterium]